MGERRSRRLLLFVALVLGLLAGLAGCGLGRRSAASGSEPSRAFYYWRTTFTLGDAERQALERLHIGKLYVRAFDVTWGADDRPELVGALQVASGQSVPASVAVTPVVFVKNEVFARAEPGAEQALAKQIWSEVARLGDALAPSKSRGPRNVRELQLDCDWTESTRDRFFALLRSLRALGGPDLRLSATIRLHQVKYRERTGVPPVDRGMLMFYNMGRFSGDARDRAIFDAGAAERYLARLGDYPLPLDVALPIWSWTLQLRDQKVVGLLQSTDPAELPALDFVAAKAPARFAVTRTTFLHGALLREGDELKAEALDAQDLRQAASLLAARLAPSTPQRTVALFDLAERNLGRHGLDTLDQTFQIVR